MRENFKRFVAIKDAVAILGAVCAEGAYDWAQVYKTPEIRLDLPRVVKKSKIETIILNKNPIYVKLSDGSHLFFSLDEFQRIKGKPAVGRTMALSMIRMPDDNTSMPSKIDSCEVL